MAGASVHEGDEEHAPVVEESDAVKEVEVAAPETCTEAWGGAAPGGVPDNISSRARTACRAAFRFLRRRPVVTGGKRAPAASP
eukprot:12935824-Prorocentrum_lima.AAC.1